MRKIWMPIVSLALAALLLLGMYNGLLQTREENREAELQAKMETLLPGSTTFTEETYTGDDANIAFVYKGENGYVIGTSTTGYAGTIRMLIGVSNDGYVTGLQVRQMEETFGLGAEALTDWQFLAQFLRTEGGVAIGSPDQEDAFSGATGEASTETETETYVDGISGATVTSKAIARCVNSAVAYVTGADIDSGATSWGG